MELEPGGRSWYRGLLLTGSLSLLSYSTLDYQPKGGAAHSELGPPTPITSKEGDYRLPPGILNWWSLVPKDSILGHIDTLHFLDNPNALVLLWMTINFNHNQDYVIGIKREIQDRLWWHTAIILVLGNWSRRVRGLRSSSTTWDWGLLHKHSRKQVSNSCHAFHDYILHLSEHRVIVCETFVIPSFQVLGLLIFFFMDHLSLQNGNC